MKSHWSFLSVTDISSDNVLRIVKTLLSNDDTYAQHLNTEQIILCVCIYYIAKSIGTPLQIIELGILISSLDTAV